MILSVAYAAQAPISLSRPHGIYTENASAVGTWESYAKIEQVYGDMSNFWAYLKFFGLPEIAGLFLWHVDDPDLAVNFDQQRDIPDEPDPPDPPDPPDGPIIGTNQNLPMESLSNHSERGTVIQGGVLGVQTQSIYFSPFYHHYLDFQSHTVCDWNS